MKIVAYIFLAIFVASVIYGIYSVHKILSFAKLRRNVTTNKAMQIITNSNRKVDLDRIFVKKNNRGFTKVEKEKMLANISKARKSILIALLSIILFAVFIAIS